MLTHQLENSDIQCKKQKKCSPTPGIEPGPLGWKPSILAIRPCGKGYKKDEKFFKKIKPRYGQFSYLLEFRTILISVHHDMKRDLESCFGTMFPRKHGTNRDFCKTRKMVS